VPKQGDRVTAKVRRPAGSSRASRLARSPGRAAPQQALPRTRPQIMKVGSTAAHARILCVGSQALDMEFKGVIRWAPPAAWHFSKWRLPAALAAPLMLRAGRARNALRQSRRGARLLRMPPALRAPSLNAVLSRLGPRCTQVSRRPDVRAGQGGGLLLLSLPRACAPPWWWRTAWPPWPPALHHARLQRPGAVPPPLDGAVAPCRRGKTRSGGGLAGSRVRLAPPADASSAPPRAAGCDVRLLQARRHSAGGRAVAG
jgi:hypothetical protein